MYLIYSTLCSIIAILSYASCYVMLAANIEDVRSIADKYIPESIADEILNRARDDVIRDRHKIYEVDKSDVIRDRHKQNKRDRTTTYINKHVNPKSPTEGKKQKSHLRITSKNDTKKYTSYEMNLDDLVAKVKKRLQIELKLIEASNDKQVQARYKKQSRDDAEATNREISRLAHHNRIYRPQTQQSRDDDEPSHYDRHHRPKTQQFRNDTELTHRHIDQPTHHDYDHKSGTQESKNDNRPAHYDRHYRPEPQESKSYDRPAHHDRHHKPEPQQSRGNNRQTYQDRNHKSKTQQSKNYELQIYHEPNKRPQTQQSRNDDRPTHHDRNLDTNKVERQKHRPLKLDFVTELENRSPEQIKNSETSIIEKNHNKTTTERRKRTTTEGLELFEKVEFGKSKESSEDYVTSAIETQSPRYKSKLGKRIDPFAEVKSPTGESKYKALNGFSNEDPTTSKPKEGVYYYDEALNYDKKNDDSKNIEKIYEESNDKPVFQRDAENNDPVIEPYAEQLENPEDERIAALSGTVLNDNNKNRENIFTPNAKKRDVNINKSVRKPSKATIIPKRDFYKISSPNYLLKMPIVGERYHFDEPIPEDDRDHEELKYIGNPPASINGKIVFSQ